MRNTDRLSGSGEMGELIRSMDWSQNPVGPVADWPQSLQTALQIVLHSRYPMFLWWGPELTNFYNDAYIAVLGGRHPKALGRPASEVWSEVWNTVGPQADFVMVEGLATWNEELLLVLERNQFPEETYFTFSYSPVLNDEGDVAGIFCACTEETERVLSQRRLQTLRSLADETAHARTAEAACSAAVTILSENQHDLPFTLLYLLDEDQNQAHLVGLTGLEGEVASCPAVVDVTDEAAPWPFREAMAASDPIEVCDLVEKLGPMPGGVWPESPHRAVVLPMSKPGQTMLAGFLVAGVSPRLAFDGEYKTFLKLVAGEVTAAVGNARAYAEERKRAEALAELDRAKTAFFSNVSHEFRTPLTLMLGPVEDTLADSEEPPTTRQRERLEVAHRNALRLQKLVNTLLDFSRIEAGRVKATFESTDLASLTAELASNFRSACEKAGLELRVSCSSLPESVYVDRDMWEKIVLNLLSNALKFTWEGRVEVSQRAEDGQVVLVVRDTGTGIPPEEVPRLFERFHRIEGTKGRTQEGSGIGLALVRELVHLHGGEVRIESSLGEGSRVKVTLPLGKAHLPADRIGASRSLTSTALGATLFVEEAMRWLPDESSATSTLEPSSLNASKPQPTDGPVAASHEQRPHILVADDNADMRNYMLRLLSNRYAVTTVADGEAVLQFARKHRPDLILSDVMMPGVDGFALVRELRADPHTQELPVLLLSARAGEEARVEGLEAGADDYLIKPFSGRELLARVASQLELAKLRLETANALRQSEEQLRDADRRKDDFLATLAHELRNPLAPLRNGLEVIRLAGDDKQTFEEARSMMQRQLEQMVRLIDDLLDISRITHNKLELRKKRVELKEVIQGAIETAQPLIAEAEHELTVDLPQGSIALDADPIRLAQVFANLLTNAAKYTEPGGHIWLTVELEGNYAIVAVRDTGIGIAEEHLPTLFEMFSQVAPALERSQGGLGIGLALVHRLVQMHDGIIEANSDGLGKGSEFVVRLPVLPTSGKPQPISPAKDTFSEIKLRILVVDDNEAAAKLMAMSLKIKGHDVDTAHDGEEAVRKAATLQPDVIFLDIGLPKLNGYQACRRIRKQPGGDQIIVIALTGWGHEEDKRKALEAGFDHHCTKPVDEQDLKPLLVPRREVSGDALDKRNDG